MSSEITAAFRCCDFRVAQVNVGDELPFICVLSMKGFGFVACVSVTWGGWHPSFILPVG